MKKVSIYIGIGLILFCIPLLKVFAQDTGDNEQLQGEGYRAPADYPHVQSTQEIEMNKIIQQQQEAIKKQNEILQKLESAEQGGIPPAGEVVEEVQQPKIVFPSSAPISESAYKCRHVTITMPKDVNCGYLITTGVGGKSAKILMLESSAAQKGQCLLDIDCEKPANH